MDLKRVGEVLKKIYELKDRKYSERIVKGAYHWKRRFEDLQNLR